MRKARISKSGSSRQVKKTKLVRSGASHGIRGLAVGRSENLGQKGIAQDKVNTQQRINESISGV